MGWGSYYLFWFLAPTILAIVSSHPAILLVVVVAFVARRWIPDPYLWLKYLARVRSLSAEIAANPENLVAKRSLAMILLAKRRPKRAVPLLEAALAREPDSAELHFLLGLANLRLGAWQPAVDSLSASLHVDDRLRYGDGYLYAGDALVKLGRLDDAEEAYQRFIAKNSSSLEGRYKLARVRKEKGDVAGAKQAERDVKATYKQLPGFQRRKQFLWYWRTQLGL